MSLFSSSAAAETKQPKFLTATGDFNEVKIFSFIADEVGNYISIKVARKEAEESDGRDFRMYMSPGATPYRLAQFKHFLHMSGHNGEFEVNSLNELAAILNTNVAGKEFRMKLAGKEYTDANGDVKLGTEIPFFPPFVESLEIPIEATTLRWDDTKDIKRLPKQMDADPQESNGGLF